jgi:hypothetical protein
MPNSIIYNVSTQSLALKKGNFYIGTGDVGKGPTSTTGYFDGVSPTSGGYVIYVRNSAGKNLIYGAPNDSQLILITNRIAGTSYTTVSECLVYFAGQTDKMVLNRNYESIVTNGLLFNSDAGFTPSYPRSGTTWYDVSLSGNTGTLTNGPTFNSADGGSIVFDGVDDRVILNSTVTLVGPFTWSIFCKSNLMTGSQNRQVYLSGNINFEQSDHDTIFIFNFAGVSINLELPIGLIPQDTFYQATLVRKLDNTFDFYYNGVKQTLRGGGNIQTSLEMTINTIGSMSGGGRFWNGNISIVNIYNRLLTDQEILQNFNALKGRFGL